MCNNNSQNNSYVKTEEQLVLKINVIMFLSTNVVKYLIK